MGRGGLPRVRIRARILSIEFQRRPANRCRRPHPHGVVLDAAGQDALLQEAGAAPGEERDDGRGEALEHGDERQAHEEGGEAWDVFVFVFV